MTPTTPLLSRKASSSSPITTIFFGVPSASGNSSDSSTGSQNRRSNSPMPVPAPLSVRNLLSSARSMGRPPILFCFWREIGAGCVHGARQRITQRLYDRPFALHRHPRAGARMRPVVPHRAVLGAAVVPERDGVFGPAEAALEQRVFGVLVEIGQHGVALVAGHADQEAGEAAVDVERLLAGHRMGAHDRMFGARILRPVGDAVIGVEPAIGLLAVMQRGQPVEIGLHPVRQRLHRPRTCWRTACRRRAAGTA